MIAHPKWCLGPPDCTAHEGPAYNLLRVHRSSIARVVGKAGTVTTRLIQDPGGQPELIITASGLSAAGGALGTAGIQQLIDNLTEQLAAARAARAEARR